MTTERRDNERRRKNTAVKNDRRRNSRRGGDRRNQSRAPLDLWVEEEKGDELYFRRTGNVSTGGLFFEQTIPHALGTEVRVRFTLPGDPRVIEAVGEVVNTPKSKDELGMGIAFSQMSDEDKTRLKAFVEANPLLS